MAGRQKAHAPGRALGGGGYFELLLNCDARGAGLLDRVMQEECPGARLYFPGRTAAGKGVALLDDNG